MTRHPAGLERRDERVEVFEGDVLAPGTAHRAVSGQDAVISVLGVPYTWGRVSTYSVGTAAIVAAMAAAGVDRLLAVTSAALAPHRDHPWWLEHVVTPILTRTIGKTLYDDMRRMESIVSASDLDWTVARPPALQTRTGQGWLATGDSVTGTVCTRADLAGFLVAELAERKWIGRATGVITPGLIVDHRLGTA